MPDDCLLQRWSVSAVNQFKIQRKRESMTIIGIVTGLVIAGEALALFVGMVILSPDAAAWVSPKNNALLLLDVLTGIAIIWLVLGGQAGTGWPGIPVLVGLATHVYREWEVRSGAPHPFCFNTPLRILNAVKLAGLVILLGWVVVSLLRAAGIMTVD
jgi:hypothetical protein